MEVRPVPGYKHYFVSSDGNVYSNWKGVIKKLRQFKTRVPPYWSVNLRDEESPPTLKGVHQLVAWAFLPKPDGRGNVLHKDGNPENNCVGNLYWGTHKENLEDSRKHGTIAKEERHGLAVMDRFRVQRLRLLKEIGAPTNERLAEMFGISRSTVRQIVRNITWNLSTN